MIRDHHKYNFDLSVHFKLISGWAYVGLPKGISMDDFQENHIEGCKIFPENMA